MLRPLGPRHLADVDKAFNPLFKLHESSVIGHADYASMNVRAYWITMLSVQPRIRRKLLETQRDALFLRIILQHLHLNLVPHVYQIARVRQASPGHVRDMQQAVDAAEIDEGAIL